MSAKDAANTIHVRKLAIRNSPRFFVPANCHHANGYNARPTTLAAMMECGGIMTIPSSILNSLYERSPSSTSSQSTVSTLSEPFALTDTA